MPGGGVSAVATRFVGAGAGSLLPEQATDMAERARRKTTGYTVAMRVLLE
jgi:hypothetical protein